MVCQRGGGGGGGGGGAMSTAGKRCRQAGARRAGTRRKLPAAVQPNSSSSSSTLACRAACLATKRPPAAPVHRLLAHAAQPQALKAAHQPDCVKHVARGKLRLQRRQQLCKASHRGVEGGTRRRNDDVSKAGGSLGEQRATPRPAWALGAPLKHPPPPPPPPPTQGAPGCSMRVGKSMVRALSGRQRVSVMKGVCGERGGGCRAVRAAT